MKFEYPEINVVNFAVEDIITTSSEGSEDGFIPGENEGGLG